MWRCIQVGVGGFGRGWLQVVKQCPEVEHVALVDTNPENLAAAVEMLGFEKRRAFAHHGVAFDSVEADFVLIVVPPFHHKEVALSALRHGLHVLTEKPMADTMEASHAIVKGAQMAGRRLMVSQNYRFRPWIRTARQVLEQGRLGRLSHVTVSFRLNPDWGPFRQAMDDVLLIEMSIHHFDMMRYLLNDDGVEVFARTWNPPWSWFQGDCACAATFQMAKGTIVCYEGTAVGFGAHTGWNGAWRIEGEKGALHFDEPDRLVLYRHGAINSGDSQPPEAIPLMEMAATNQAYALQEFIASLEGEREAETSGEDNLQSLAMVFAAIDSAHSGQPKRMGDYLR